MERDNDIYAFREMDENERQEYLDNASKNALKLSNATPEEIYSSLEVYVKKYDKIMSLYEETLLSKKEQLETEIKNLENEKKTLLKYGIKKAVEVLSFEHYMELIKNASQIKISTSIANYIEEAIDVIYRNEDKILRKLQPNSSIPIIISPGYETEIDMLSYYDMMKSIWIYGKFPIKCMSKEKASRFLSSASKRENETGLKLIEIQNKLDSLNKELKHIEKNSNSEEEKLKFSTYSESMKNFKKEISLNLGHRLDVFKKFAPDSKFKSSIVETLKLCQKETANKTGKFYNLICSLSILDLIKNVKLGKIKNPKESNSIVKLDKIKNSKEADFSE